MPDSAALDTPPPDRFGSDLAHLFDYCRGLLEQDAEAIRTARSVLDSEHEPLADREQLRAWLFGLARSLALALRPPSTDQPAYLPAALIAASSEETDNGVVRAFRSLTDRDREILDLVYRHGIRPADLPALLIVPGEEAYRCLVNAEEEFISLAAGPEAALGANLEDIAALPLVALPTVEGGQPQLADQPGRPLQEEAPRRSAGRRRAQFAAAAVIPVAAILCGVMLFPAPRHPAASHGAAGLPGGSDSQPDLRLSTSTHGSPHAARSGVSGHRSAPGQQVHLGPVASATGLPEPTSSPSSTVITGLTVTAQPVPCPSGTKASFRWHYAANGGAGGWSGTATHVCPGGFTMGPQAMGGNLQVSPGTTLQAGYDFTLPGNNKSLTMTVSGQVTFAVSCVSKTAPSSPSLTVPLQPLTYQITGAQWYPSGDQSSPLVYQGSVAVPALCGPGGAMSLAKGGTFTATLG